jgi:quercetin dioxygenase-like cupin family protein
MKPKDVAFTFVLGIALGAVVQAGIAAERAGQVNRQLLTENLTGCVSKQLSVAILESPPGSIGFHFHPGETFTYVLDGKLTHEVRGQSVSTLESGGFIHDDNREVHQTNYLTPVKLLIVRVLDQGQPETTRVE